MNPGFLTCVETDSGKNMDDAVFIPAIKSGKPENHTGWWFLFHQGKLLVQMSSEYAKVPMSENLDLSSLALDRIQYLGNLNGLPCYSAYMPDDTAPEGMAFHGLRNLFGHMEEALFEAASMGLHIVEWDRTHIYCGRCGAENQDKTDERAKICPQCGMVNYPRVSPAVIVAVIRDKKILLARSGRFPKSRMYSVIAGYVEPGETLEECVCRELEEEVSIQVKNLRYFGSQPWPYSGSLMTGFTAEYAGGEICVDGKEILEAGWYSASNLPSVPGWGSIAGKLIDWFIKNYHYNNKPNKHKGVRSL
jgi:NAD+ diphosphatase